MTDPPGPGNSGDVQRLAERLGASARIVVFTGAGISTESGIPDYRSPGGIWQTVKPIYYQEFVRDPSAREAYWRRKLELFDAFERAQPNEGHRAIARLERSGTLLGVVTQNIDGLHQAAGSSPARVLELHGTTRETVCLSCRGRETWETTRERIRAGEAVPRCPACGGILKPATVLFGENLDPVVLRKAEAWAEACDLMLVVGSTLLVEPAASLPRLAASAGAALAIVNLGDTPLDDRADIRVRGRAGEVLGACVPPLPA